MKPESARHAAVSNAASPALNAAVNTVDRRSTMVEYLSQGILFDTADKKQRMSAFLERKNERGDARPEARRPT